MYRLLLLLLFPTLAFAQTSAAVDVILRTDGEEISGRVLTVSPSEVAYVPTPGADTLHLATNDVFLVRYANGTRELLQAAAPAPVTGATLSPEARAAQARADARRCYQGHEAFNGALGATLVGSVFWGALATAAISNAPPQAKNLHVPTPARLADAPYATAYQAEATTIKHRKAWAGYGVGLGIQVLLLGVLIAGTAH